MLVKNNHQIIFAGLYAPPANVLEVEGASHVDLHGSRSFFSLGLLRALIRLIKKEKPDVIQANGSDTLKYAVLAKVFMPGLRITYRNISMISAWSKKGSLRHSFNKWLFRHVDYVTSVGEQALQDLRQSYQYPSTQTAVIRRGIPHFDYDSSVEKKKIAATFQFNANATLLIHVGQFSPEKNHQFLIDCFPLIKKQCPDVKLLLLGEGKLLQEMKEKVMNKELQQDIIFVGYQKEVQRWLSAADLFVMTSTVEGVPGVVLEAGMQKVPAVAVNVGGVGEVVIDHQTGLLVPQHDAQLLADAVIDLLKDEEKRKQYGKNACTFVQQNYSLEKCRTSFEAVYEKLVKQAC